MKCEEHTRNFTDAENDTITELSGQTNPCSCLISVLLSATSSLIGWMKRKDNLLMYGVYKLNIVFDLLKMICQGNAHVWLWLSLDYPKAQTKVFDSEWKSFDSLLGAVRDQLKVSCGFISNFCFC